ncbi:unnamed protein product [Linum trigynum]|uniref:WIBG Mago-binding domain-containing protein n=1 Tax=Linum trigynum TaxID=586398 RepID=A0AAV2EIZ0_9ROSI
MAATANGGGRRGSSGGVGDEPLEKMTEISKTLKEGERILAPTRRPDGSLRKPIRIRAGYVPQDEVAIYQSKGALWKKEMESQQSVPPGYDPVDAKPKSKAAKRNERKKEKRLQAALEKGKNSEGVSDVDVENEEVQSTEDLDHTSKSVEALTSQMKAIAVSANSIGVTPPVDSSEASCPEPAIQDIDKRIRALKKKIRLAEAQQQQKNAAENAKPEQLEKFTKLEGWREELKLLESTRAEQVSS